MELTRAVTPLAVAEDLTSEPADFGSSDRSLPAVSRHFCDRTDPTHQRTLAASLAEDGQPGMVGEWMQLADGSCGEH